MTEAKKPYRYCIFLHSGSYDRVFQAMSITNVVLATGGEVHIFFSYGALKRLVKGNTDKVVIEGEAASFKEEIEKNLNRGTLDSISEMIDIAKRFGRLKIYACTGSMAVLNIARNELIDAVDCSMGLVAFLQLVKEADQTLYI
ncbi:MAG: DsrE/DsrF/DrsH-like family protein [Deltaproteobacteria bacterium]|nr:DsrE/DsrF/DrsH-like family protein [Deltaproteobacteria bacterium]